MRRTGAAIGVAKLAGLTFVCLLLLSLASSSVLAGSISSERTPLSIDTPTQIESKPELWRSATRSGAWVTVSTSPYVYDYAVGVVGAGENIYIANSSTEGTNRFMRYKTNVGGWDILSNPSIWFKNGTCLAWDNSSYIYALLGASTNGEKRYYFYRYNISPPNTWTSLSSTPHYQGAGDALAWVPASVFGGGSNYLYAFVGMGRHTGPSPSEGSEFYRYDIVSGTWSGALGLPSGWDDTDDGASLVWTGGQYLYALRGEESETTANYEFYRYDLISNTWTIRSSIPAYSHDGGSGGVGDGGSLLWIGGSRSDYIYALSGNQAVPEPIWDNRFYRYTISTDSWARLEDLPAGVGDQNGPRLGFANENIYCWRGCDGDGSLYAYSVDTIPPAAPELISPMNGLLTSDNTPTFMWGNVYDLSGVTYNLQVDNNSNFSSPAINASNLADTTYTVPGENALLGGTYYWRVRAVDGTGNPSGWSDVWQFTRFTPRGRIVIRGNEDFTPANGVTGGSGTANDPYIIENWEIDAAVAGPTWAGAIDVNETDAYFIIRNCYIHGGLGNTNSLWFAIKFLDVWHGAVRNNLINNVETAGVMIYDNGPEVGVPFSAYNTVDNNTIENCGGGAIWFIGDPTSLVINNRVKNAHAGICITSSTNIIVQNNVIDNVEPHTEWGGGILINGQADNILIENNTFKNSKLYGMDLFWCYNVTVRYNNIENSANRGIRIRMSGSDPENIKIYLNNIINSGRIPQGEVFKDNLSMNGKVMWDNGTYGNYWSDWTTPDADGDRIVDNPYILAGPLGSSNGNWDRYPITQLFEFISDTIPPPTPVLISPKNAVVTDDNTPTFVWTAVSDPSGVNYILQYSTDPTFGTGTTIEGLTENTYTVSIELPDNVYYWRVQAVDGASNPSGWSEIWAFTVPPVITITTVEQLQEMKDDLTAYYALGNDIDASDTHTWNEDGSGGYYGFEPIGTFSPDNFKGSFNGRGYKISNLYINRGGTNYVGLFACIGSGGVVKNVGLDNENVICNNWGGGLVGVMIGLVTVDNCYSTGSVSSGALYIGGLVGQSSNPTVVEVSTISNCFSTASVMGWSGTVGGLVGLNYNYGTVSNCYSTGSVSSGGANVGGLVGRNEGTVTNCYSTGSVSTIGSYVGGLVATNYGTLTNSYSRGSVSGSGSQIGGLVGRNYGNISNSYSTGFVSGGSSLGGLVGYKAAAATVSNSFWDSETSGQATSAGGTGKTTAQMKDVRTFTDVGWSVGLTTPWDFVGDPYDDTGNEDIWNINPAINDGYPFFTWAFYGKKRFPIALEKLSVEYRLKRYN